MKTTILLAIAFCASTLCAQQIDYKVNNHPAEVMKESYGIALQAVYSQDASTGVRYMTNRETNSFAGVRFYKIWTGDTYRYEARPYTTDNGSPTSVNGVWMVLEDGTRIGGDTLQVVSPGLTKDSAYELTGTINLTQDQFRILCSKRVVSVQTGARSNTISKSQGKKAMKFNRCIWNNKDGKPQFKQ